MANPLGKVISKGSGRRLAVGDIHGCIRSFEALLQQVQPSETDQLFLLGDYANKGPASRQVLDLIMQLQQDFEVYALLGNHDLKVLDFLKETNPSLKEELIEEQASDIIAIPTEERSSYIDFLEGLHYYFILDDFLLAHAGFNFALSNPFLGKNEMINIKDFFYDSVRAQNKTVVHGHAPYELNVIKNRILQRSKTLPLDNGCVYPERPGQGNLLCLNLDTSELLVQPNVEED